MTFTEKCEMRKFDFSAKTLLWSLFKTITEEHQGTVCGRLVDGNNREVVILVNNVSELPDIP